MVKDYFIVDESEDYLYAIHQNFSNNFFQSYLVKFDTSYPTTSNVNTIYLLKKSYYGGNITNLKFQDDENIVFTFYKDGEYI